MKTMIESKQLLEYLLEDTVRRGAYELWITPEKESFLLVKDYAREDLDVVISNDEFLHILQFLLGPKHMTQLEEKGSFCFRKSVNDRKFIFIVYLRKGDWGLLAAERWNRSLSPIVFTRDLKISPQLNLEGFLKGKE